MVSSSLRERKRAASNTPRSAAYPPPSRRSVSSPVAFDEDSSSSFVPFISAGLRSVSVSSVSSVLKARGRVAAASSFLNAAAAAAAFILATAPAAVATDVRSVAAARARESRAAIAFSMSFTRSFPGFWLRTRAKSLAPRSFRGTKTPSISSSALWSPSPPRPSSPSDADASSPSSVSGEETSRGAHTARAESLRPRGPMPRFTSASASALAYPAARNSNAATSASARRGFVSGGFGFRTAGVLGSYLAASSGPFSRPERGAPGAKFTDWSLDGLNSRGTFAGNPTPRTRHTNGSNPNCATRTSSSSVAVAAVVGENVTETVADPSAGTIPNEGFTEKQARDGGESFSFSLERSRCFLRTPVSFRIVRDVFSSRRMSSYSNAMGAAHVIVTFRVCVSPTTHAPKSIARGNVTSFITG